MIYNLLADRWELSTDTDVNYMVLGEKRCLIPPREAGRVDASEASGRVGCRFQV